MKGPVDGPTTARSELGAALSSAWVSAGDNWKEALMTETPSTLEELRSIFDMIDEDGGGVLDRDEITMLADYFTEDTMSDEQIDAMMADMDEDGSGEVDFEEFAAWWERRKNPIVDIKSPPGSPKVRKTKKLVRSVSPPNFWLCCSQPEG